MAKDDDVKRANEERRLAEELKRGQAQAQQAHAAATQQAKAPEPSRDQNRGYLDSYAALMNSRMIEDEEFLAARGWIRLHPTASGGHMWDDPVAVNGKEELVAGPLMRNRINNEEYRTIQTVCQPARIMRNTFQAAALQRDRDQEEAKAKQAVPA
jgi:hypothetical protein